MKREAEALASRPATPAASPEPSDEDDLPQNDDQKRKLAIQQQIARLEKQLRAKERDSRTKQRDTQPVAKTKKPLVLGGYPYLPRYFFVRLSSLDSSSPPRSCRWSCNNMRACNRPPRLCCSMPGREAAIRRNRSQVGLGRVIVSRLPPTLCHCHLPIARACSVPSRRPPPIR